MKVAWAVVWVVTWAAWAAAAPTKIDDESEESDSSIRIIQAEVFTNPSPSSQSSSLHDKRHTITNPGTASLAPTSSVGLSLPSSPSYSNPSSVVRYGVPLDLNPVDPAYRVALTSHDPSPLTPPDFFIHEFEALEDLMKADSLSSGVPLSAGSPRSYQGDGSEVGGQAAAGSVPDPLQVSQIGGLQGDFGDLQIVPGDILNLNSGDFQGFQEASLAGTGGLQGDFATFVGTDLLGSTGELQGVSGDFGDPFLGSGGLDGLQLGSEGFKSLQGDSYGAALPLGNTGGLQSESGGYDGISLSLGNTGRLQGGSVSFDGVSLPLGNTGGLQGGSGSFDGVSLPLGNTGGLQGGSVSFDGVSLPLGNTGGLQGGSVSFNGVSLPFGNTGGPQDGSVSYDGLQSGSYGVSLPFNNNEGFLGGSGGLEGLQGNSYGVSLPFGSSGGLQLGDMSLSELQAHLGISSAGYVSDGLNEVALHAAESGGGGVALPSTAGGDVNTGVLPGASGVIDVPPGDFGNVGVPLSEAVELNHFSIDPTDVPGTFTASSFDAASLDSLGQLLSDNVEEIQDPGQSLGSFLMEINGKNGMMVLPASELDALQNGQLSVAAVANSSLLTNYQVSTEVDDDDLFDNDIDLNTKDPNDLEVIPSLATILASTASGGTSNDLAVSASAATPDITTPTTTTTTTTTEGPPRLGTILPNLLFSKGQFFGTLFGGLTDIAETIYKAITETDWTAPPPPRSYY